MNVSLLVGVLFVLSAVLTACETPSTGRAIDHPYDDPLGLPIPPGITSPLVPGSLGFYVGGKSCEQVSGSMSSSECLPSCPSATRQLIKLNVDGNPDNLCPQGGVCCVYKDPYRGFKQDYVIVDPFGNPEYNPPVLRPYWDTFQLYQADINNDVCLYGCVTYDDQGNCVETHMCDRNNCQEPYFDYARCIGTYFFCNHYHDAYCVDDHNLCNRRSYPTCMNDPDCWPSSASEQQKHSLCTDSCIAPLLNEYSTCVQRSGSTICPVGAFDWQGERRVKGYFGAFTHQGYDVDDRYGCSAYDNYPLYGDTYDCCLYRSDQTPYFAGVPDWVKAHAFDSLFLHNPTYEGEVTGVSVTMSDVTLPRPHVLDATFYWQTESAPPYTNSAQYYCGQAPFFEREGIIGPRTVNDYERCWRCLNRWGADECCDGIDNDGDGKIDRKDTGCGPDFSCKNAGCYEGGVCFG